jgi:hypothetical protein
VWLRIRLFLRREFKTKALLCCAAILLVGCAKSAPEAERFLATRILAQEVAKIASPKTVLVISNPFTRESGRSPEYMRLKRRVWEGWKKASAAA